jgi:hypothetical protein
MTIKSNKNLLRTSLNINLELLLLKLYSKKVY